jgi:hypothetical protein
MADLYDQHGRPLTGPTRAETLELQLQEAVADRRLVERDAEMLAWHVLNGSPSTTGELEPRDRLRLVKAATEVWQKDPQAGAAIDLLNDFVFGRGVPRPRAKDSDVQKILDETWDDPDNKLILTSFDKLVEKGTDLQIQCNVFFLIFEGDDGKVKLGLLDHDRVKHVVRSEENRLRILYYAVEEAKYRYDFNEDREIPVTELGKPKIMYYEHFRNVDDEIAEGGMPKMPPRERTGDGRVYQLVCNKKSEMAFGQPTMRRLMRWFSAYNEFMTSRVDVVKAAAAFIMKRRVKGGEAAVQRIAAQRLNQASELATEEWIGHAGPPPASILNENEAVVHEALNLQTNAGNALQDGQMLRSQVSAGTHFPQHYLGDAGSANLATATSMELPVLKHVEATQEIWEALFRALADRAIDVAIRTGRLEERRPAEELPQPPTSEPPPQDLNAVQAHPTQVQDEQDTKRDLSYEFSLPSPLKRLLGDTINAMSNMVKTLDPNGTNLELSKLYLTLCLQELEIEDPASYVETIFPPGYQDPIMAAQLQAAQQPPGGQQPADGGQPPDQRGVPGQQPNQLNPFGSQPQSSPNTPASYGDTSGNPYDSNRGIRARRPEEIQQARFEDLDPDTRANAHARAKEVEHLWTVELAEVLDQELAGYNPGSNGKRH